MSSLFLFGAGASFGSGPCSPGPPPLGRALFDALRNKGGVASRVSAAMADVFRQDFEEGMDQFWSEHNTWTSELLRDMAGFFAEFAPLPGNLYVRLIELLGGTRKKAVFATTNYDLLIEQAISAVGLYTSYTGFPVPPKNIPVLKIHGSCNFFPDLRGGGISGVSFDLGKSSGGAVLGAPVKIARSTQEVREFCRREDSIAPAIAMYHPSKRVLYCPDFVRHQHEQFAQAISDAARIFVIGLRVHPVDTHIWEPLAESRCPLYYVGQEPEVFSDWASKSNRDRAFPVASSFADALPVIERRLHRA